MAMVAWCVIIQPAGTIACVIAFFFVRFLTVNYFSRVVASSSLAGENEKEKNRLISPQLKLSRKK
jgi:hypothetical protein